MKAAIINKDGNEPIFGDFTDPVVSNNSDKVLINISAVALSNLTKGHAEGKHYTSDLQYPFIPGIDGVGKDMEGNRLYFAMTNHPYGSLAEQTVVDRNLTLSIPENLDDITTAALINPAVSAMGALKYRANFVAGQTVLINGATSTAGTLAVQIAKYLGAKKVIATGRDIKKLEKLKSIGADITTPISNKKGVYEKQIMNSIADGVDVVLD